jgi:hypothetical protein
MLTVSINGADDGPAFGQAFARAEDEFGDGTDVIAAVCGEWENLRDGAAAQLPGDEGFQRELAISEAGELRQLITPSRSKRRPSI